jgi:hypothetical protein
MSRANCYYETPVASHSSGSKTILSMEKFKIPRTKQCAKCPWKTSTNPFDIPDGYALEKHENLSCTIAKGLNVGQRNLQAMACHHSDGNDKMYCVGWLHNQLGVGNNIALRIQMMRCENICELKVYGEQHQRFEETLPNAQ